MRDYAQEMSPGRSERAFRSGNERLYEAYNDLHALAQDFEKPFDAPAILVVGHQTDGKSGKDVKYETCPFLSKNYSIAVKMPFKTFEILFYSLGGGTDGFPVQPCRWWHEDSPPYHSAHEI